MVSSGFNEGEKIAAKDALCGGLPWGRLNPFQGKNKSYPLHELSSLGTEHIMDLLAAIKTNQVVLLKYQKHFEDTSTERMVEPYERSSMIKSCVKTNSDVVNLLRRNVVRLSGVCILLLFCSYLCIRSKISN